MPASRPVPPYTSPASAAEEARSREIAREMHEQNAARRVYVPAAFNGTENDKHADGITRLAGLTGGFRAYVEAGIALGVCPPFVESPFAGGQVKLAFKANPKTMRAWALEFADTLIDPAALPSGYTRWW